MPVPRIIPVLDVLGGVVVRAVGGRRHEYQPIRSRVTRSTEPGQVARDLLAATGAKELYVADLDAIRGGAVSNATRALIDSLAVPVWLDCGATSAEFPRSVRRVVGFESLETPDRLSGVPAFSLDLWNRELYGNWRSWGVGSSEDIFGVLDRAVEKGVRALIVLDLPAVGTNTGPGTLPLCRQIRGRYPDLELLTGGGVRHAQDVARLGAVGVDGVLVASAIHDGLHFTTETSA